MKWSDLDVVVDWMKMEEWIDGVDDEDGVRCCCRWGGMACDAWVKGG